MAQAPSWKPLTRDYDALKQSNSLQRRGADTHPLIPRKLVEFVGRRDDGEIDVLSVDRIDPLSMMLTQDVVDPLSDMNVPSRLQDNKKSNASKTTLQQKQQSASSKPVAQAATKVPEATSAIEGGMMDEIYESEMSLNWDLKKQVILKDYSVTGNVRMGSDLMSDSADADNQGTRRVDKYQQRLRQLEGTSKDNNRKNQFEISQTEYIDHIKNLKQDLQEAWVRDEKVTALRLSVRIAKLVGDVTMPQFYPSTFVHITDCLDGFADLVYRRIKGKSEGTLPSSIPGPSNMPAIAMKGSVYKLKNDFTCDDVSAEAKDICRNWFYKISCIRELLPRIYVETALIPCYRFILSADSFGPILGRIGAVIRGIGDSLVSGYAKCYLARKGYELEQIAASIGCILPRTYATSLFQDYLFAFQQIPVDPAVPINNVTANVSRVLTSSDLTVSQYLHLHEPAVEWICKIVARNSGKDVFRHILQQFRENCNDSMVLRYILGAFDPSLYSNVATAVLALASRSRQTCMTHIEIFRMLGVRFVSNPPLEDQRIPVLNDVWRQVSLITDEQTDVSKTNGSWTDKQTSALTLYVACSSAWLEVLARHYASNDVVVLMKDVTRRLENAAQLSGTASTKGDMESSRVNLQEFQLTDSCMRHLEYFVRGITNHTSKLGSTIFSSSDCLLRILDLFRGQKKIDICKDILQSFSLSAKSDATATAASEANISSDVLLLHSLFDVARILHDSLNQLSAEGEQRHVSHLINQFLNRIDFGRDVEQQLNLYVDSRAAFSNLEMVIDNLVVLSASLAMKTLRIMKNKHSKKTMAFVKGCLAYCYITIPSINYNVFRKMSLLLHCSHVALQNQCLPQTDAFLKSFISLIPDIPPYDDGSGNLLIWAIVSQNLDVQEETKATTPVAATARPGLLPAGTLPSQRSLVAQESTPVTSTSSSSSSKRVSTEARLVHILKYLCSTLVVLPGHPQSGPFYILQGLLKALSQYPWQQDMMTSNLPNQAETTNISYVIGGNGSCLGAKSKVWLDVVNVLSVYSQRRFPYRIDRIESNDQLYGGSDSYKADLSQLTASVMNDIMEQVGQLSQAKLSPTTYSNITAIQLQSRLVLDLAVRIACLFDLNPSTCVLISRLLDKASKAVFSDLTISYESSAKYIKRKAMDAKSIRYSSQVDVQTDAELINGIDLVLVACKNLLSAATVGSSVGSSKQADEPSSSSLPSSAGRGLRTPSSVVVSPSFSSSSSASAAKSVATTTTTPTANPLAAGILDTPIIPVKSSAKSSSSSSSSTKPDTPVSSLPKLTSPSIPISASPGAKPSTTVVSKNSKETIISPI